MSEQTDFPLNQASWLGQVAWNTDGLVPVITQDMSTGRVLTLAWMNRESLVATQESGFATYWSRSRAKLWRKGEQSGFAQKISEIRMDCDNDALLLLVEQQGGIACHTGRESCFYQVLNAEQWQSVDPVLKNPEDIYKR